MYKIQNASKKLLIYNQTLPTMRQFLFLTLILCTIFSQKMVAEFANVSNNINNECELDMFFAYECDYQTSINEVVFYITGGSGDYEVFVNGSTNGELTSGIYDAVVPSSYDPYSIICLDAITGYTVEMSIIFTQCIYGPDPNYYYFLINSEITQPTCGENNGSIEIGISPGCFFANETLSNNELWFDWVAEGANADPQWDDYEIWSQFADWEEWLFWVSDNFTGQENWFEAYYSFLDDICSEYCYYPEEEHCLIKELNYKWYDMDGDLVSTEEDPSNLSAGVYYLYIQIVGDGGFKYFTNFYINENNSEVEETPEVCIIDSNCSFWIEVNDILNAETFIYDSNSSESLPIESLVLHNLYSTLFSNVSGITGILRADSTLNYGGPFLVYDDYFAEYILEVIDLEGCVSYHPYSVVENCSSLRKVVLDISNTGDDLNVIDIGLFDIDNCDLTLDDFEYTLINELGDTIPMDNYIPNGSYTMTLSYEYCSQTIDIVLDEIAEVICDFDVYQVVGEYNPDTGQYPVQYFVFGQSGKQYTFEINGISIETQTVDSTGIFSFDIELLPNENTTPYEILISDSICGKSFSLVLPEYSEESNGFCSFESDIFTICDTNTYEIGISIVGEPNEMYEVLFMGVLDTSFQITTDSMGIINYTSPIYPNGTGFTVFVSNENCTVYQNTPMIDCSPDVAFSVLNFEVKAVYPNPSNGIVKLEGFLPAAGVVQIKLFNILGQEVLNKTEFRPSGLNIFELDFSGLNVGNYIIQTTYKNQQKIERLVKY